MLGRHLQDILRFFECRFSIGQREIVIRGVEGGVLSILLSGCFLFAFQQSLDDMVEDEFRPALGQHHELFLGRRDVVVANQSLRTCLSN